MTKAEAQIKADEYLKQIQEDCPVQISFNYEVTEDHPLGFIFFYNTVEYWHSRDFTKSLAGNGPLLVVRETGNTISLPSHHSVKRSLIKLSTTLGARPPTPDC